MLQEITLYKNEVNRQLSNTDHYCKLMTNPTKELQTLILQITNEGLEQGFLSKNEHQFLNTESPRTPVIYTLPKVHKNQTNPPGRPIVSGCGSILEPLGQ